MGYGFGRFSPQVPKPKPAGSGNLKAGYLAQPKPMDVGLNFGLWEAWVPDLGTRVSVLFSNSKNCIAHFPITPKLLKSNYYILYYILLSNVVPS